uniref:Condensin complex subunit 1-like n=1 Tax=Petromyzon marinus TaxID=7757 RepID=A0AAJ7SJW9_PETMA|nr:condensin complex subunit 1-like [Petromyzon marinus]
MIASADPDIVGSNLDALVTLGLGDEVEEVEQEEEERGVKEVGKEVKKKSHPMDYELALGVCSALSALARPHKARGGADVKSFRLPHGHTVFTRLQHALLTGICQASPGWLPFATEALSVIYSLSEQPEVTGEAVLRGATLSVLSLADPAGHNLHPGHNQGEEEGEEGGGGGGGCKDPEGGGGGGGDSSIVAEAAPTVAAAAAAAATSAAAAATTSAAAAPTVAAAAAAATSAAAAAPTVAAAAATSSSAAAAAACVPTVALVHLLWLAGEVALRQLVHLDGPVCTELVRRRVQCEEQAEKNQQQQQHQQQVSASLRKGANRRHSQRQQGGKESMGEDDLGLSGASAEDVEGELIRHVCETELLAEGNLLAVFVPLLDAVCTNPSRYGEPALLTAATLSLAKFMTLSPQLCESRLRLLFTVLERSSLPGVRANTMVALGDLAFRFPNLLEPWTAHLYARLKDDCAVVRSCSLRVLAHLVVSDMVKVRGHISNVAALLVDKDPSIASQARAFFTELAKKDNALYNALPDIVSRLSDPEEGIAEEPFHTVMRQLFSYIQKDRQVESLVEKLCHRFRTTR